MEKDQKVYLNEYARVCFRNIADEDYIAARILYRNKSYDQFLTMAHQAIEKYIKAILLFNQVSIKQKNKGIHNLKLLLERCDIKIPHFNIEKRTRETLKYFNGLDQIRYLTYSFSANSNYLLDLDSAIFDLRRYCQSNIDKAKGLSRLNIKDLRLRKNIVLDGYLERYLKKPDKYKEKYNNLIWKNFYYGNNKKNTIKYGHTFWAKSSPISTKNDSASYDVVKEFVPFPKELKKFFEDNGSKPDQLKSDSDVFKEIFE